jgi:Bacterial Ig domain
MVYRSLTLAGLLALMPAVAQAGCRCKPFEFHPEMNDGVVVDVIVDAGSFCTHNFGEGQGYTFNSISFVHEPDNGTLVAAGTNRYVYTPAKGFKGKDAYVFKICATKGGRRGCSTVAFVSQVR